MNILDRIVDRKRHEVELLKASGLRQPEAEVDAPRGFAKALFRPDAAEGRHSSPMRVIAEAKKASPSKGLICPDFDPVAIAKDYEAAGASAISVLTDVDFFQGSLDYLMAVRQNVKLPVLRKDFIIDPIQIREACAYGADAILLIAAILEVEAMAEFIHQARELGMDCLVEVHDEEEAEAAMRAGSRLIGINNRNLKDFSVSIETTARVRKVIDPEIPVVSESGIKDGKDILYLKEHGVSAVLIGESLMRADDRRRKLKEFLV